MRTMYHKLLALMAIMAVTLGATAATNYNINVGGVEVTSSNAGQVTGGDIKFKASSGYVSYNAITKTLTLKDVTISRSGSNDRAIHNRGCEGLTIQILGTCDFTCSGCSTLKLERTTFLEVYSGNTCNIKCTSSGDDAIWITHDSSTTLAIQGSGDTNLTSTNGEGIAGNNNEHVMLRSGNININAKRGAFSDLKSVQFTPDNNSTTTHGINYHMIVTLQPTGSSSYAHARNVGTINTGTNVSVKYPTYQGSASTMLPSSSYYSKEFIISDEVASSSYTSIGNFLYQTTTLTYDGADAALLVGPTVLWKYAYPSSIEVPGYVRVNSRTCQTIIAAGAFSSWRALTTARLKYGVCQIRDNAFAYNTNFTTVYIPGSVTSIGADAFWLTKLNTMYWSTLSPSTVTLASSAFETGNSTMGKVYLPTQGVADNLTTTKVLNYFNKYVDNINCYDIALSNARYVVTKRAIVGGTDGEMALTGFNGSAVSISSSNDNTLLRTDVDGWDCGTFRCTSVAPKAFYNNKSITSATLSSDYLKSIDEYAFGNAGLSTLTMSKYINNIDKNAFNGSSITKVYWNIPSYKDITSNFNSPFFPIASKISDLYIGDGVTRIPAYLFYGLGAIRVGLPSTLESIGNYAFAYSSLLEVTIPNSVKTIGNYAFASLSNLHTVSIGSGITSLSGSAFNACANITRVYWSPVAYADFSASPFAGAASSINSVVFNIVSKVPAYLCHNFSNLTSISLPTSLKTIGAHAFEGSGLRSLNTAWVETIGESAFAYCGDLATVTFGTALNRINNGAFGYCKALQSITLPASLTSMGTSVFTGCTSLATATDNSKLTSLPDYTFQTCTALKQYKIRDGVRTVGKWAFMSSGLTEVEIPQSVTNIGEMAFGTSSLQQITSWPRSEDVTLGASVFYLVNKQTCKLHVKPSCLAKYETADQWKDFFNIVDDLDDPDYNPLDVNGDGSVNVGDVNAVLAEILAHPDGDGDNKYDVSGDGAVNVGDVNLILAYILEHPDE